MPPTSPKQEGNQDESQHRYFTRDSLYNDHSDLSRRGGGGGGMSDSNLKEGNKGSSTIDKIQIESKE